MACAISLTIKTQHHIVVAYDDDNDTASLFIDGDLQNSNRTTISLKNIQDDNNWLGRSQFTMIPYYDGRINEFRIHDRALGLESVKQVNLSGRKSTWTSH